MKVHVAPTGNLIHSVPKFSLKLCAVQAFVITTVIILGCSSPDRVSAQAFPGAGSNRMDGDWRNVDRAPGNFAEIVIEGNNIHPYAACNPTACDWGVIKAMSFGSSVQSAYPVALLAQVNNGFDQVWIAVRLGVDDRLRVETFTRFNDGSHRADYSVVSYFDRGVPPANPYVHP